MRWWLAAVLLIHTGCGAMLRVTVAPTIDTSGNVGVAVKVTPSGGLRQAMLSPTVGGSYLGRERVGALEVAPEITYWMEPSLAGVERRMPALRGALFFGAHFWWIDGHQKILNGIGANFAILPRLISWSGGDRHNPGYRVAHLGVELSGEYDWGSPSEVLGRGIFSIGLTADVGSVDGD